ncbi:hypothetical protein ACOSQ4_005938 [Xanthoceras sorbifolium]
MKPFLNVEAGIQSILRMALINLQSYTTISEPPESLGNCIATRTRFDDANGSPKPTGFDANRTLSEPSVLDSLADSGHLHSMRTTLFRKIVENQRKT